MAKHYRCIIEVRGYELDAFGHVNHANYIHYMEHARWRVLREEGITPALFAKWKRWPVIANLTAQFMRPTFLGDRLEVRTHISDHGRTNFTFEQCIYRRDEAVFKGIVQAVMVNDKGRPSALPDEVSRMWSDQDHGAGV